jgi:RNA polymerase-binding transcription factor DksA
MDSATLTSIQEKLEAERKSLLEQLRSASGRTPDEPDNRTATFPQYGDSPEENATEVADYTSNLSVEKQLENSLRSIEATLDRIAKKTYGRCSVCQEEIDADRLIAMPTAETCRTHASA